MNVTNLIVIIVIIAILIPAIMGTLKHLKGEGSCCGGPKEKPVRKKIKGKVLKTVIINIDGMMCSNCKNRVQRVLDDLDGVVAKVNLDKKIAVVSLYEDIDINSLTNAITSKGYEVKSVEIQ